MGKFNVSKSDMLDFLAEQPDSNVDDDSDITAVALTDAGVEFTIEEKEKTEAGSEG